MEETQLITLPAVLPSIEADTEALGFRMGSDRRTGSLLRVLAASRPGGKLLELGTGTGLSAAWLLDGMDRGSSLVTVDNDEVCLAVARRHLGHDPRVRMLQADGTSALKALSGQRFDLIFADTWPGKFLELDLALGLLAEGGMYVIDDLSPQPTWLEEHAAKVARLVAALSANPDLVFCQMAWCTGIALATRRAVRGDLHPPANGF
jgi:predicted O-methyltransferase YrrM